MGDFILNNYGTLTIMVEAIPVIIGIILLKKFKSTKVIYFIYFSLFVVLGEIIAGYPSELKAGNFIWLKELIVGTVFERNYWWYTLFWQVGSSIFFAYYFYKSLIKPLFKKILKYAIIIFLSIAFIWCIINWESLLNSYSYTINFSSLILKLLTLALFFIDTLNNDDSINLTKSFDFNIAWIILIWWLVTTPLLFFNDYFNALDEQYTNLQWFIRFFSNVFMYVGFTLVLIFCKPPKNNYTLT